MPSSQAGPCRGRVSRREEFAEDYTPLGLRDAEADALGKLRQRLVDALLVARLDALHAVAHDDPVDLAAFLDRAGLARFEDQLGVEAQAANLEGFGLDLPDQIEIDEAVVHRRDQRSALPRDGKGSSGTACENAKRRAGEIAAAFSATSPRVVRRRALEHRSRRWQSISSRAQVSARFAR